MHSRDERLEAENGKQGAGHLIPELFTQVSTAQSSDVFETDGNALVVPRAVSYSAQELLHITNALKLSAKLYDPAERATLSSQENVDLPLYAHAVVAGVRLLASRAPMAAIVVGFLHDTGRGYVKGSQEVLAEAINRKFDECVPDGNVAGLIRRVVPPGRPAATEWHAEKPVVVQRILEEFSHPPGIAGAYSADDTEYIVRAVIAAHNTFSGVRRKWGPNETLPMLRHAAEAGILLLGAGLSKEVVAAGFMHDFYEGYTNCAPREQLEAFVLTNFGERVHQLISAVTEPPKSDAAGNWFERKTAVVRQLDAESRDANCVACAAKISTLAEGNKFVYVGAKARDWSAGDEYENLRMFKLLQDLFAQKEVPPVLLERFDIEIRRWASCIEEHHEQTH